MFGKTTQSRHRRTSMQTACSYKPCDGTTVAGRAHLYPNKLFNDIPTASTSACATPNDAADSPTWNASRAMYLWTSYILLSPAYVGKSGVPILEQPSSVPKNRYKCVRRLLGDEVISI